MKRLFIFLLVGTSIIGAQQFVPANTVAELLNANGVRSPQGIPSNVQTMYIANGDLRFYDAVRTGAEFAFAGYPVTRLPERDDTPLDRKIHVVWANTRSGTLRYAAITSDIPSGAISAIRIQGNYLFVSTHLSPSAENTLVLTRDLKVRRELYGYPKATLANGTLLFQNSQVHFAPTHIAELSAYDPARNIERKIYPPARPDPVREDFISRVRTEYNLRGRDWFQQHNHHMNPERFDSSLTEVVVNDQANTIAFLVYYDNPINDSGDPGASRQQVVTTCTSMNQVDRITCKERSLDVWAKALNVPVAIPNVNEPMTPAVSEILRRAAAATNVVP
jgi:hypothetical protein